MSTNARVWLLLVCVFLFGMVVEALLSRAFAHDWYTGLHNEYGHSCCGGNDCAPLVDGDVEERPGGYWIRSRQVFVPQSRAQSARVDDGHYHACFWGGPYAGEAPGVPKCFFYPNRGY